MTRSRFSWPKFWSERCIEMLDRNLAALRHLGSRIRLRCPIVPGVNDMASRLRQLDAFSGPWQAGGVRIAWIRLLEFRVEAA